MQLDAPGSLHKRANNPETAPPPPPTCLWNPGSRMGRAEHYSATTSGQRGTGRNPPPNHAPATRPIPSPPGRAPGSFRAHPRVPLQGCGAAGPMAAVTGEPDQVWCPPPAWAPGRHSPAWSGRAAGTPPWQRQPPASRAVSALSPRCPLRSGVERSGAEWSGAPRRPPRTALPRPAPHRPAVTSGRAARAGAEPRGGARSPAERPGGAGLAAAPLPVGLRRRRVPRAPWLARCQ